jgi:murein DD-endopeptidase MepM/ murein hydrolase activator NlpD
MDCMRLRCLPSLILLAATACGPALRPLPPLAPLPEPPAESPMPAESPAPVTRIEPERAPDADVELLRERGLGIPVQGIAVSRIADSFDAPRDGRRRHDAVDIMAPRGTPVIAADDGIILRVGTNTLGGNVVWACDPARKFAYYYAHLGHYARGLREGQAVKRGDVLGYVGTTGNAPPDTPHLHFQLMKILDQRHYSTGTPLNPLPFFTAVGATR